MKREGTSKGFPDYIVLIPPDRSINGQGFTLYIELKRLKGSVTSKEQVEWVEALRALDTASVDAFIAKGADQAIGIIRKHLKPGTAPSPF